MLADAGGLPTARNAGRVLGDPLGEHARRVLKREGHLGRGPHGTRCLRDTTDAILLLTANVPGSPGVYRLYSGLNICFYVGQAQHLANRLADHLQTSEDNPCIRRKVAGGSCYFDYAVVSSKVERDQVEAQEISRLRPECNRQ